MGVPRRIDTIVQMHIKINSQYVSKTEKIKFLGVVLDARLLWKAHVQYVSNKLAKGIGILCKAKKYLNRKTLVNMYYTFVYPYFTYCITVWGANTETLRPLVKLQKRIIKIMTGAKRFDSVSRHFRELKILKLDEIYKYSILIFMFKYYKCMLPKVFGEFYQLNETVHQYQTRQTNLLHVPLAKSCQKSSSIRCMGVKIWNNNFIKVGNNTRISIFKRHVKELLLQGEIL